MTLGSHNEAAARLLAELAAEPDDAGRRERLTAALDAVAWHERTSANARYSDELRELVVRLFPEEDLAALSSSTLLDAALVKMQELRDHCAGLEKRNQQLAEALTAMQDVLSAIAALRR